MQSVLPYKKENSSGSIINIGSTACACSKAGVDTLTKYTALQVGKDNIRCSCIRTGLIVTPENDVHVSQVLKNIFLSNIMVNRYGCPEDIASLAAFLASDESEYVSVQGMDVVGGLNAYASSVAQFRALNSRT